MQDLFWYITCLKCKKDYEQEKEKMYSRIAQNYVRFFDRVKRHRKDSVMLRYYRVLALMLVEAFFQAYPKSRLSYDQQAFKGEIVDLCGTCLLAFCSYFAISFTLHQSYFISFTPSPHLTHTVSLRCQQLF